MERGSQFVLNAPYVPGMFEYSDTLSTNNATRNICSFIVIWLFIYHSSICVLIPSIISALLFVKYFLSKLYSILGE